MLSAPQLRRFARHALVTATGVAQPDRGQLASAFDLLCEQLRTRLQPLFGATAVSALFARARRLAAAEFAWLSEVVPEDGKRCSLDALHRADGTFPSELIEEGLSAVLAHEVGLLTAFIGDDFVMPLVQEAWGATLLSERTASSEGDHE
jgi:hypothetical protein